MFVGSLWRMIAAIFVSGPHALDLALMHVSSYKIQRVTHLKTCVSRENSLQRLPSKIILYNSDGVFCVSDGWGWPIVQHESASVYVQAWKFSPSDILFSRTDTRGSGISVSPTIPLQGPFDIDSHIFLVQVTLIKI